MIGEWGARVQEAAALERAVWTQKWGVRTLPADGLRRGGVALGGRRNGYNVPRLSSCLFFPLPSLEHLPLQPFFPHLSHSPLPSSPLLLGLSLILPLPVGPQPIKPSCFRSPSPPSASRSPPCFCPSPASFAVGSLSVSVSSSLWVVLRFASPLPFSLP